MALRHIYIDMATISPGRHQEAEQTAGSSHDAALIAATHTFAVGFLAGYHIVCWSW